MISVLAKEIKDFLETCKRDEFLDLRSKIVWALDDTPITIGIYETEQNCAWYKQLLNFRRIKRVKEQRIKDRQIKIERYVHDMNNKIAIGNIREMYIFRLYLMKLFDQHDFVRLQRDKKEVIRFNIQYDANPTQYKDGIRLHLDPPTKKPIGKHR